jgi:hypothetical protein
MTRRTFLQLESLEDRMTPALHVTAPVAQAVAITRQTVVTQPVVTQSATLGTLSSLRTGMAAALGCTGGTGVSNGSGGGGSTGSPVGPGPGS